MDNDGQDRMIRRGAANRSQGDVNINVRVHDRRAKRATRDDMTAIRSVGGIRHSARAFSLRLAVPLAFLVLVAGLATPTRTQAQDWSRVQYHPIAVADNLHMFAGGGGNIALLVGEDGALLVDAGYKEISEKLMLAVKAKTDAPIRYLVNTHWHLDHAGGNERVASSGAIIVAHRNARQLMTEERDIAVIDEHIMPSPPGALPVVTFDRSLDLHVNGEHVRLVHIEHAHTNGDCIVQFEQANVVHVGDLMFNGMFPFIDLNAGGSLDGIVDGLDRALALANTDTKVIPGHGRLTDAKGLREYRNMLATVRDRVRELVSQKKSREEVIAATATQPFDATWGKSWLDPDTWVGLVYDCMIRK